MVSPLAAQVAEYRATIRGGDGDRGKCTIEVEVDGSADVEIRGDRALLRTLSGNPALWRRFVCNARLPFAPGEFRFRGIDGRGSQDLLQDPRTGRGVAIVRIQDPRGGSEGYTFDLEWRGESLEPPPTIQPFPPGRGRGLRRGEDDTFGRAVSACQRAVTQRLERDGYRNIQFQSVTADNRPGRNDWIVGSVRAQRTQAGRPFELTFGCSVNLNTGAVRSVEVDRR